MRLLDRRRVRCPASERDDDLALGVPLAKVGDGFTSSGQRVRPTNDRRQLPGLDELLQDEQIVLLRALRAHADMLRHCLLYTSDAADE